MKVRAKTDRVTLLLWLSTNPFLKIHNTILKSGTHLLNNVLLWIAFSIRPLHFFSDSQLFRSGSFFTNCHTVLYPNPIYQYYGPKNMGLKNTTKTVIRIGILITFKTILTVLLVPYHFSRINAKLQITTIKQPLKIKRGSFFNKLTANPAAVQIIQMPYLAKNDFFTFPASWLLYS